MSTKNNRSTCKVGGSLGKVYLSNGKTAGAICWHIRMDNTCGAHGNTKCKHKQEQAKGGEL